jgi:deoxyguanosine kinase
MLPRKIYICFGANLGDPISTFQKARMMLSDSIGTVYGVSKLYKTTPLTKQGIEPDSVPSYMNAAVCFSSILSPSKILETCLEVEQKLGRTRDPQNQLASRTLDLDIALIEGEIFESDILSIPHPRLHERDFMLQPIIDISSDLIHSTLNKKCSVILSELGSSFVESCIAERW